jgi:hypothetical protein
MRTRMNRRQFLRRAGGTAVGLSLACAGVAHTQQPADGERRSNVEPMAYRELYCPAHFGNSYEVMGRNEMRDLLAEARHWGFNAYGDWFDSADLKNPRNNPRKEYLLPQALWERKLGSFRIAQDLNFAIDLVTTPNHVFLDQLAPDLLADTSDQRFFGQLLCPSIPKAREIILRNHRELFEDLRSAGVRLDSISACPFDYGGCACERCRPWIVTFGKLFVEIHERGKSTTCSSNGPIRRRRDGLPHSPRISPTARSRPPRVSRCPTAASCTHSCTSVTATRHRRATPMARGDRWSRPSVYPRR